MRHFNFAVNDRLYERIRAACNAINRERHAANPPRVRKGRRVPQLSMAATARVALTLGLAFLEAQLKEE